MTDFEQSEMIRYSRHFPVIGLDGQKKLKNAKVLCVGAGGLGCPSLQYLAAVGIGTLGIMDGDHVELSNLQRQILFTEKDIGRPKSMVVAERLQALNRHTVIQTHHAFFSHHNQALLEQYDVILDATDNYEARYLLNSVSRNLKKPLVSASIYQYDAQISVFNHNDGPCYQCLYPEPPPAEFAPNCAVAGVLGILPGVAGTIQATEAIKIILGFDQTLSGTLLCLNLLSMRFNQFAITKQDCSTHPTIDFHHKTITVPKDVTKTISATELHHMCTSHHDLQLIDVRQPYERAICNIGGDLVPLSEVEASLSHYDKDRLTVVYCKSGSRSAQALQLFLNAGFSNIRSLEGGIMNWQETINPSLMRY